MECAIWTPAPPNARKGSNLVNRVAAAGSLIVTSLLARVPKRVSSVNPQPALSLGDGNWSSCPTDEVSKAPSEWSHRSSYAINGIERSWAANERTAPEIKSQETISILCNADPHAVPDFAGLVVPASEPQRAFSAKIEPIEPTIDPQRCCEPSWSSR